MYKFLSFNYTIEYKPGRKNGVADALSRVMGEEEGMEENKGENTHSLLALSSPILNQFQEVKNENMQNDYLLKVRSNI